METWLYLGILFLHVGPAQQPAILINSYSYPGSMHYAFLHYIAT